MTHSELDQWRLQHVLTDAEFSELPGHQSGKVRESYDLPGRPPRDDRDRPPVRV